MREVIIGSEYELNPHSATKWAPGKVGYSIHPKRLLVFSEDDRLTRTRAAGTFWPRLLSGIWSHRCGKVKSLHRWRR